MRRKTRWARILVRLVHDNRIRPCTDNVEFPMTYRLEQPMSVLMFVCNPANEAEKRISVPFSTESVFNTIILPISEKVGAEIVPLFGIGLEVSAGDLPQIEGELSTIRKLLPESLWEKEYLEGRIALLISTLRKLFSDNPEAIAFIG